jgi:hypothetical protein
MPKWHIPVYTLNTIYEWLLWSWSNGSWIYNCLCNQCLSLLMLWIWISIRERCTSSCDKVCLWLVTGLWFSPVPSTNKTDRHDITESGIKHHQTNTILLFTNVARWLTVGYIQKRKRFHSSINHINVALCYLSQFFPQLSS